MLGKRHKWIKKPHPSIIRKSKFEYGSFRHKQCKDCGLIKGDIKVGFGRYNTIYFDTDENSKIIENSVLYGSLPRSCEKMELLPDELFKINI